MMVAQYLPAIKSKSYRVSKEGVKNAATRRPRGGWKNWPLKPAYLSPFKLVPASPAASDGRPLRNRHHQAFNPECTWKHRRLWPLLADRYRHVRG